MLFYVTIYLMSCGHSRDPHRHLGEIVKIEIRSGAAEGLRYGKKQAIRPERCRGSDGDRARWKAGY